MIPTSRNQIAHEKGLEDCEHCLNAGTTATVLSKDIANSHNWMLNYPPGENEIVRHGLCGGENNEYMFGGSKYEEPGQLPIFSDHVDITIKITAHHAGWFEFRLCNADVHGLPITQECLNEHLLERDPSDPSPSPIDVAYPGKYYTIPKCDPNSGIQKMRYKLPQGLKRDRCVLQWWWVSANSCHGGGYENVSFPDTYSNCIGDGGVVGWRPRENSQCRAGYGYPEEFWNCADISIASSGTESPTLTNSPTTSIATNTPTNIATTSPTMSNSNCSTVVPDGVDCSSNSNCCPSGKACYRKNQWWAGCLSTCTPGNIDNYDDFTWACTPVSDIANDDISCDNIEMLPSVNNTGFAILHGKPRLDGVLLVDQYGAPLQLMGMSSHGIHWFPDCYTKESIQFLVENWGMNLFRIAMYVGEGGYLSEPQSNLVMLENIITWCTDLGIYVMIDFHVLTPGNPNIYLGDTGVAIDFWETIANKYRTYDNVLYEIANEPNGVSWEIVKLYHDTVIPAIREIDPETIIVAGTATWSQDIHLAAELPVADPHNVMYAFHFYAGTHLGLLSRVQEMSTVIPIFVTEWGTSEASGNNGPFLENAKQFLDFFNSGIKLSWAQWSYCDKSETSAALLPVSCASKLWDHTSCSGSFVRNYMKKHVQRNNGGVRTSQPTSTASPTFESTGSPTFESTSSPTFESTGSPTFESTSSPTFESTGSPTFESTSSPSLSNNECMNAIYSTCGGQGYSGSTCCPEGTLCSVHNEWYSQCVPDPNRTCRVTNEECTADEESCCATLTCQGGQWYRACLPE